MSDLEERVLGYLPDPNNFQKGSEDFVSFLQEQAPELVQEILNWYLFVYLGSFIVLLIALVILLWTGIDLLKYCNKKFAAGSYYDDTLYVILTPHIMFIVLVFGGICFSLKWVQIFIAPKLFLLEYIGNLL